jgi:hypothetical protein
VGLKEMKKSAEILLAGLLLAWGAGGCRQPTTAQEDWERAQARQTPVAFERFLHLHPDSPQAAQARRQRDQLLRAGRAAPFRDLRRVRVVVNEEYTQWNSPARHRDLLVHAAAHGAEKLLQYAGLEVVADTAAPCDAVFAVEITGQLSGTEYGEPGQRPEFYWTGATVNGAVTLRAAGGGEIREEFAGSAGTPEPPKHLRFVLYRTTPNLILSQAALAVVEEKIALVIGRALGPQLLVAYLYPQEAEKFRGANDALARLKDPQTIEPLIEMVDEVDTGVYDDAVLILRAMTGQELEFDPEEWREWWAQQGGKLGD